MLSPNRMKFRKQQRHLLYRTGVATRGNQISFGEYGLIATELGMISSRQIEAARIAMTRKIKRSGQVWIRIFPDRTYTSKPAETRMGKGKGGVDKWVAPMKIGTMMFEMAGVTPELAKEAMMLAAAKLPVKTKFVIRRDLA